MTIILMGLWMRLGYGVHKKTETQIHDQMFVRLEGDETGLLGFWRFDSGSGSQLIDETSNNIHGTLTNFDLTNAWVPSGAPIGNGLLDGSTHVDVRALWAVTPAAPVTRSGWHSHGNSGGTYINLNYSTFGHNNVAGSSVLTSDLPAGVEARYGRVWHVYRHGNPHANILIDVSVAHGVYSFFRNRFRLCIVVSGWYFRAFQCVFWKHIYFRSRNYY